VELCNYCGIIILDSEREPNPCTYCNHTGFFYLGFEGEYDPIDVRAEHNVLFDPTKFTPVMQELYWKNLSSEKKQKHQKYIDNLAEQVRIRRKESYEAEDAWEKFEHELEEANKEL
jgi:hypothetical protein